MAYISPAINSPSGFSACLFPFAHLANYTNIIYLPQVFLILDFSLWLVIYVKRKLKQVYSNASAKVAQVKKKDLASQFIDSIMEICWGSDLQGFLLY